MITAFLLSIPGYILQALLLPLPVGGAVPTEWVNAVNTIWNDINAFSFIVPVGTLLSVLGLALAYHAGIFTVHAFNWILRKIPGMS